MHKIYETLGDIIKAAQQKAGITNEELAAKVGVSERYIYRIENEGKKPSFDVLYKLIRELSIVSDSIFIQRRRKRIQKWKVSFACSIIAMSVLCRLFKLLQKQL